MEKHLEEKHIFHPTEDLSVSVNDKEYQISIFPIERNIKSFLELPNVFDEIIGNQRRLKNNSERDNCLYNFINGPLWREVELSYADDNIIPLFFYQDDFTPDNVVGPHKSETSLSTFYSSLPTMPAFTLASSYSVFPIMVSKSTFVKEQTNVAVMHVFNKLRLLEDGIYIDLPNRNIKVKIIPILNVGDNISLNLLQGFETSPRSTFFCRTCIMPMDLMNRAVRDDEDLLRNEDNYELHEYGVKEISIFNDFRHYKVFQNQSHDITHDWMLGIFKKDLYRLLNELIESHEVQLADINFVIQHFDYGRNDKSNKISDIETKHLRNRSEDLPFYAREIWNTVNYLPFFLRPFLQTEDRVFQFALLMVDILDELLKPSINQQSADNFNDLIERHHTEFMELFEDHLRPKYHFATHYGRIGMMCGPMKYLWTFHFERFHQHIKSYLAVNKSRVNTPHSIGSKITYQRAKLLFNNENIFKKVQSFTLTPSHIRPYFIFLSNHLNMEEITMTSRVCYKGLEYQLNDYIFENDQQILRILEIFVNEADAMFVVTEKFYISYVAELRSFKLENSLNQYSSYNLENLQNPPVNGHLFEDNIYFRFKYF